MSIPKWTEERTNALVEFVGEESPVSQETVREAAERLETSPRSISSKLRKLEYDVELVGASTAKKFSDEQAATLAELLESNSGVYTYEELAAAFEDGTFSAKQIQGKVLSMELHGHVRPAEKKEVVKKFSDAEEATFISMANDGSSAEDIAEALGKTIQAVRGKGLSLMRAGSIESVPKQTSVKERVDALASVVDNLSTMTVAEIATAIEKTERGVKTMLTRRGLTCADYDGAKRKEKAASAE